MAEHIWTVLCGRRLVDPDGEVISLIDVGESVFVEGLDRQLEEAASQGKKGTIINVPSVLVSWWYRGDRGEEVVLSARYSMVNPAGTEILVQELNQEWGDETSLFRRIYINMVKIPVEVPGLHWFVVQQRKASKSKEPRWTTVTRIPLLIDKA